MAVAVVVLVARRQLLFSRARASFAAGIASQPPRQYPPGIPPAHSAWQRRAAGVYEKTPASRLLLPETYFCAQLFAFCRIRSHRRPDQQFAEDAAAAGVGVVVESLQGGTAVRAWHQTGPCLKSATRSGERRREEQGASSTRATSSRKTAACLFGAAWSLLPGSCSLLLLLLRRIDYRLLLQRSRTVRGAVRQLLLATAPREYHARVLLLP